MFYYRIADVVLKSCIKLPSYDAFSCAEGTFDIYLSQTMKMPQPGKDSVSGSAVHRKQKDGWFFHTLYTDQRGLFISEDYTFLEILGVQEPDIIGIEEWFIRIALECILIRKGYVSLHSSAVEKNCAAYAFTGPSMMGKSTRANAWMEALDAELINGDRPLINVHKLDLYGVPWDGKEQCFRSVHYPLRVICEVRRSDKSVYARKMSFKQRRKALLRQCFVPMWDTELAAIQMANITKLARQTEMVRIFCGPGAEDAKMLYNIIQNKEYLKEEPDMKAKQGFVLRNVVDEFILMPTGDNIGKFNGTVLLNEVSAFVWEKLQNPISKADLLQAILDEYEVEKAVASADLDALLKTLKDYSVIEDD